MTKTPTPPAHLAPATRKWWRQVNADYDLEQHQARLLTLAGEAWDRCTSARELIQRDGLCVAGREGGLRPHPAIAIERDSRAAFAKIVKDLNLETASPDRGPGRPTSPPHWNGKS